MRKKKFFSTSISRYATLSHVNGNYTEIVMEYDQFNNLGIASYLDLFKSKLEKGVVYSYITKVSKDEDIYFTLHETQRYFKLVDSQELERIQALEDMVNIRLEKIFDNYNDILEGDIDFIILQFTLINPEYYTDELKISNLDKVKEIIPKKKVNKINKEFALFDPGILELKGETLEIKYYKGKSYLDNPNLEEFVFDNIDLDIENSVFKLVKHKGKYYVVCTLQLENGGVVKQSLNVYGDSLYKVYEYKDESGNLVRKSGEYLTSFNRNNEIIDIMKNINFKSIYKSIGNKPKRYTVNDNIGTLDLETYKDENDISHCYAIGFYTQDSGTVTHYINENLDSSELVSGLLDEMFKNNYWSRYKFYCHNLGGFDAPFIIKALINYNDKLDRGKYKFDIFTRDNSIIRLTIKKRIPKIKGNSIIYVNRSISIYDSLTILPMSLRELCRVYKVENSKTFFPYEFVKPNTLEYIGITPSKEYYKISPEDHLEFNKFYNENYSQLWNLKEETLKYLELDLISLYQVLKKVNLSMFSMFGIQMTDNSTVSGIAMNIFLTNYYNGKDNKGIPLISSTQVYRDIYKAYYGGRVEVFKPTAVNNEKLYYYDVNSLYPHASLNDLPGLNWTFKKYIVEPNIEDLFGFYYCKITCNKGYIGLLPYRSENGSLKFPLGQWYGWYFSEELKLAKENGYKIEVLKGYTTDRVSNIFDEFVNTIYEMKTSPRNISEKNVAKLILNSLIGRFGMNPKKTVTKILTAEEHNKISITRPLKNSIYLDDFNYLDTFLPEIHREICMQFGIDYSKVIDNPLFNFKSGKSITNTNLSISTAAAILSYSRIYMVKTMLKVLQAGGRIYYTDTDSLVTDIKLENSMVHPKNLGKFKLEHEVVDCYFLADKTYLIKNSKGEIIKKAKGVKKSSLSYEDYIRLYNMEIFKGPIKTITKKSYELGTVDIYDKIVTLNINKYNKRDRKSVV